MPFMFILGAYGYILLKFVLGTMFFSFGIIYHHECLAYMLPCGEA
jgi:uncharacterized membrane protein